MVVQHRCIPSMDVYRHIYVFKVFVQLAAVYTLVQTDGVHYMCVPSLVLIGCSIEKMLSINMFFL